MFIDYSQLSTENNIFLKLFYFVTGLGHESVMIFFVLSGYFVGGSALSKKNNFRFRNYLVARLSRLYTPLLPMLIFTYFIDSITIGLLPELFNGVYRDVLNSGPADSVSYSTSILTLLGNIFFLQNIAFPVYGSNDPLWSLSNEFWYYIAFPLMIVSPSKFRTNHSNYLKIILIVCTLIIFHQIGFIEGYVIWLFGCIVYFLSKRLNLKCPYIQFLSFIFFIASLLNAKMKVINLISSDLFVGLTFSFLLLCILSGENVFKSKYMNKISIKLSEVSYSLYIVHFPVLMLVFASNKNYLNISPTFLTIMLFFVFVILFYFIGFFYWFLFEKRTKKVYNFMIRTFGIE